MIDYGRSVKASNKTFINQVNDMRSAVDRTMMNWQGSAASTASGRALSHHVSGTKIDECADMLGDLQIMWGNYLAGIRDSLLDLVDKTIPAAGMKVGDDGTVTAPRVPLLGNSDGIQSALLQQSQLDAAAKGLEQRAKRLLKDFGKNEGLAADAIYVPANLLNLLRSEPTNNLNNTEGTGPGKRGGPHYVLGRPTRPGYATDDHYKWNSKRRTEADIKAYMKWRSIQAGGWLAGLDDGTDMYGHYLDGSGTPKKFDYPEAYREDPNVKRSVDNEIALAAAAADKFARGGHTSFSITGDTRTVGGTKNEYDPRFPYPRTENWQKTTGGYQQWSHSNVRVEGNRVIMEITVEAGDRYNFNPKDSDLASGTPDKVNGRFTEVGLAKPFDTHGSLTKEISWELGKPPPVQVDSPGDPGRSTTGDSSRSMSDEDRPDGGSNNREKNQPDRTKQSAN